MYIERLELKNFRNLDPLALDFSSDSIALFGANAQGKTNLLEALYVCATGKSFRSKSSRDLIAHHEEFAWLRAIFNRQGVRHQIELHLHPRKKTLVVDDRKAQSAVKLLEMVNVVSFFPDDLRIVKGSPEDRRRFFDRSIANHRAQFVAATLSYQRALKSRNQLLRDKSPVDPMLVQAFDAQLIQHGSFLQRCRQEQIDALQPLLKKYFAQMLGANFSFEITLLSGLGSEHKNCPIDRYAEVFQESLKQRFFVDQQRGNTTVGPHRCDVSFRLNGKSARDFASQGQQRVMVLSLKLAEVAFLRSRLGCTPILLLDDVSSELDRDKTRILFELVQNSESQAWISTTGVVPIPLSSETQRYRVHGGQVCPTAGTDASELNI